jgi:hypothetical protein
LDSGSRGGEEDKTSSGSEDVGSNSETSSSSSEGIKGVEGNGSN